MERLNLSEILDLPFLFNRKQSVLKALLKWTLLPLVIVFPIYPFLLQAQMNIGQSLDQLYMNFFTNICKESKQICLFFSAVVLSPTVFASLTFVTTLIDFSHESSVFHKYKIQQNFHPYDNMDKYWKTVRKVATNLLFVTPLMIFLMQPIILNTIDFGKLHSLKTEFLFYYGHRIMHYGKIYKRIHKVHHEWTAPFGLTCIYTHPLEYAINNVFFVVIVPCIVRSHITGLIAWSVFILIYTFNAHMGYHLPLMPSPQSHDFHHLSFNNCYGMLGFLDGLHGTDAAFKKHIAYQRAVTYLSKDSINELIPETDK